METLEARLTKFLSNYNDAESIDSIMASRPEEKRRRADFLLWNRRAIVEVKSLQIDPLSKIESEVRKHKNKSDFPLCYGENRLPDVLKRLPDGNEVNRKIFGAITRSVEDHMRSAEEQIEQTKEIFNIQDPIRLLLLINESVDTIRPEDAGRRVAQLMLRKRTGQYNYPTIDVAWLVFESHVHQVSPGLNGFVSMLIANTNSRLPEWFDPAFGALQTSWAHRNYGALITTYIDNPATLDSQSSRSEKSRFQSQ